MATGYVARLRQAGAHLAIPRLAGQAVRRLGWGVADQAVSSLTNMAVSIYVVRSLGAVQFGAFSLAYVTYGLILNASRGLATDPLIVRYSGVTTRSWRRAVKGSTGMAIVVGLAAGVCVLAAAMAFSGAARAAFIALGLTTPGLMLQDSWRFSFFAAQRGWHAFLNDAIWGATLLPALVLLRATGHGNVFWFMLAWGGGAYVAALVGVVQAGMLLPRPSLALRWFSQHGDLGIRYLFEGTSSNVAGQARGYGTAAIVGLAAVGYVQASVTLMGPMTVLILGMGLVAIPEAARLAHRSPHRVPLFSAMVGGGLALLGVTWGVVLLIAVPRGLGSWLLGPIWRPTYPLVLAQTFVVAGIALARGAGIGLHGLGAARRSLRAAISAAVLTSAGTLIGAALGGAAGAIYGMGAGGWVAVVVYWVELRAALREHDATAGTAGLGGKRASGRHRSGARKTVETSS